MVHRDSGLSLQQTKPELVLLDLRNHVATTRWWSNWMLELELILVSEEMATVTSEEILRLHLARLYGHFRPR